MFVSDWMTKQVVTVVPGDSVSHALHAMREKGFKHLPVVRDGAVLGVISDRDIKRFCPSSATSLDIHEINYLLAKAKVKDAMGKHLVTTTADTPVEQAALVLFEKSIGCLPVVDGDVLVGILTDRDIFRALVDITGVRHGGHRICVTIADAPGTIRTVADIVRRHGFGLRGILTSYEGVPAGSRQLVIRTDVAGDVAALRVELEATYPAVRINLQDTVTGKQAG
jgi:acetoin utilization protein AcuB